MRVKVSAHREVYVVVRVMIMLSAHTLSMGCFAIFYLHKAFRLYLYHGRLSLCLQYYIRLRVCARLVGCDNLCDVCACVWVCVGV